MRKPQDLIPMGPQQSLTVMWPLFKCQSNNVGLPEDFLHGPETRFSHARPLLAQNSAMYSYNIGLVEKNTERNKSYRSLLKYPFSVFPLFQ